MTRTDGTETLRIVNTYDPSAYGDAWSASYDRLYESRDDVTAIRRTLDALAGGRRTLEMGVGTGRLALPLMEAGYDVVGVETSSAMIARLRDKPGGERLRVEQADMRTLNLTERFDLVLILFSTMFLLPSQQDQAQTLETASRHLAPGGHVVGETFVPDHARWSGGQRVAVSRWTEDALELEAAIHDRAAQTIDVRYVAIGRTGTEVRPLHLRYAWPSEIDLMARLAGMQLAHRWAGWDHEPYRSDSSSAISVYRAAR